MNDVGRRDVDWAGVAVACAVLVLLAVALAASWQLSSPLAVVGVAALAVVVVALVFRGGLSSLSLQAGGVLLKARWRNSTRCRSRSAARQRR